MEKAKILGGENGDFGVFFSIFFLSSSSPSSFFNFGLIIYMNLYMGLMNLDLDLVCPYCCGGGGCRYWVAVVVVGGTVLQWWCLAVSDAGLL